MKTFTATSLAAGAALIGFLAPRPGSLHLPDFQGQRATTLAPARSATADSNDRMIAVTGVGPAGELVLCVLDTETRQLAVYEVSGGAKSMRGVTLVGARRIDLDLQLYGYNDQSEYPYRELQRLFQKKAGEAPSSSALDVGSGGGPK